MFKSESTPKLETRVLGDGAIEELRQSLRGHLILPNDASYETARKVWNGAINRHPAMIARCAGVEDVVESVRFARSERLLTAIRGGAHNVAGHGTCDGGIVIDLSAMREVQIDADAGVARVQGGARWSEVDQAAQTFGLATTGGMISSTGVGGLTLGGGIGWLARKYGLACDNLLAAELVTADGTVLRTTEQQHPELLWALRGAGSNFGVVTSFEFRLHPVGQVLGGAILIALDDAAAFLRRYREFAPDARDELSTVLVFMTVPPSPDFPAELHGRKALAVSVCYAGPAEDGERAIAPLRRFCEPLLERIAVIPYAVRQQLQDPSAPAGLQNYWKSDYLTGLDDDLINTVVERAAHTTSPRTQIHLYQLGGAAARIGEDDSAYAHRSAPYLLSIVMLWDNAEADPSPHIEWTQSFSSQLRPHAAGAYVNFLGEEGPARVRDAYGPSTYGRLVAIKAQYDPTNFFRLNHNVKPAT